MKNIVILTTYILSSCGMPKGAQEDSGVSGQHQNERGTVEYQSSYQDSGDIKVQLTINSDKKIDATLSPYTGLKSLDGNDSALVYEEIQLLKSSIAEMEKLEDHPTKDALLLLSEYISEVPEGYPIGRSQYDMDMSLSHAGIQCSSDSASNSCENRCGMGCGSEPTGWTKDCLSLDRCKLSADGQRGACGEAWQRSADDWVMSKQLGCHI